MPIPLEKQAAGYIHARNTTNCKDCFWPVHSGRSMRCALHGPNDEITDNGSCNMFLEWDLEPRAGRCIQPLGFIDKVRSGYTERDYIMSCKTCRFYMPAQQICKLVSCKSQGDDQGFIHQDACCNLWENSPLVGQIELKRGKGK